MPTPTTPFQLTDQFNMANFNEKIADTNTYIQEMVAAVQAAGAKIQTGSYVGTGTYGADNPCSLTFDKTPILVVVYLKRIYVSHAGATSGVASALPYEEAFIWVPEQTDAPIEYGQGLIFTYSSNKLQWYNEKQASYQLNNNGTIYKYIVVN